MYLRGEADKLRQESKDLLYRLLQLPDGYPSEEVDRLIDCIVSAAMMEIAADVQERSRDF